MSTGGLNYAVGRFIFNSSSLFRLTDDTFSKTRFEMCLVCATLSSSECLSVPHYIESSLVLGEGSNSDPVGFSLYRDTQSLYRF